MPLAEEEIAAAKKAYTQIRDYDAYRKQSIILPLLSTLPLAFITFDNWMKGKTYHLVYGALIIFGGWPLCLLARFWRMHRLKSRYADDNRLLEELKQKYGAELPVGILTEVIEEHPLLEHWNRRLEKRAILWRLDAFLSRKPVSA